MKKSVLSKDFFTVCLILVMAVNAHAVSESDQEEKEQNQAIEIPSLVGLPSESLDIIGLAGVIKWESELTQDPEYRSSARHLGLIAPYISTQKLLDLEEFFPLMRERAPEALSEAESEISLSDRVVSHADCVKYFGKGGLFERIKKINFTRVDMDSKCIAEFPKALKSLSFIDTRMTQPQVRSLEQLAASTPAVASLVQRAASSPETAERLKRFVRCENTRAIGSNELREIFQFRELTYLAITSADLPKTVAKELSENLPELRSLDLSKNCIESTGAYDIIQNLPALAQLNLSHNWIEKEVAEKITREATHIPHLDLSHNLGIPGSMYIATMTSLTSLNIPLDDLQGNRTKSAYLNTKDS